MYFYIRCAILRSEWCLVLIGRRIDIVAVVNLIPQVFVDRTGLIAHFELPETWDSQQEVLVVDQTLVFWEALVVVPDLPVHAIKKRAFCELQIMFSLKSVMQLELICILVSIKEH